MRHCDCSYLPQASTSQWQSKRYILHPQRPSIDEGKELELSLTMARRTIDGKMIKKPRRTVDYGGEMDGWILNRKYRPNPSFMPCMRPSPSYIIGVRSIRLILRRKMTIIRTAVATKGLSYEYLDISLHQIRRYFDEQSTLSGQLRCVDTRGEARPIGVHERRIHAMDWPYIQF